MTKLEKLAVQELHSLHCQIVEKTAQLAGTTPGEEETIRAQIEVLENQFEEKHDALIG